MGAVYETLNGAGGTSVALASGSKGSYAAFSTVARDSCGLELIFLYSNNNRKVSYDFAFGTDIIIPDIYVQPSQTPVRISIPGLLIPAGVTPQMRSRSDTTGNVSVFMRVKNFEPGERHSFVRADNIGYDSTNNNAGSIDLTTDGSWVEIEDSTQRDYKGFILQAGRSTTALTLAQNTDWALGIGGSGSEVELGRYTNRAANASPNITCNASPLFRKDIPAGSRLAGLASGATTTEKVTLGLLMLY